MGRFATLLSVLVSGLTCLAVQAQSIPWAKIPGSQVKQLKAEERETVARLLNELFSYYGCSETLVACLNAEKDSHTARRMAAYVVRLVRRGKSAKLVRQAVAARAKSAHPYRAVKFDLKAYPAHGDPKAPVKVVEFADFQCPFCAKVTPALERIAKALDGKVVIYFRHFPIKSHPKALRAALATQAADKFGRFWPYLLHLYANRHRLDEQHLVQYAGELGIDTSQFKEAMGSTDVRTRVRTDKVAGLKLGIKETPTLFINGKRYYGPLDDDSLRDRIEEEIDILNGLK